MENKLSASTKTFIMILYITWQLQQGQQPHICGIHPVWSLLEVNWGCFFVGWLVGWLVGCSFFVFGRDLPHMTKFGSLYNTQDLNWQHESELFMSTITTLGTEPIWFYGRSACEPLHSCPRRHLFNVFSSYLMNPHTEYGIGRQVLSPHSLLNASDQTFPHNFMQAIKRDKSCIIGYSDHCRHIRNCQSKINYYATTPGILCPLPCLQAYVIVCMTL